VLVTDRGRPVARIVPAQGTTGRDAHIDDLVRRGLARRGTGKIPSDYWTRECAADPEGAARAALQDEREDGR